MQMYWVPTLYHTMLMEIQETLDALASTVYHLGRKRENIELSL